MSQLPNIAFISLRALPPMPTAIVWLPNQLPKLYVDAGNRRIIVTKECFQFRQSTPTHILSFPNLSAWPINVNSNH